MKRIVFGLILTCAFLGIIYGSYKILDVKTYHIRFNSNGGIKVASLEINENSPTGELPVSTRENYNFLGWYLDNKLFDVNMPITKNYTLEAKWEEKDSKVYTISFDTLGGSLVKDLKVKENEVLKAFPLPEKEGYTFKNWLYQNKAIEELLVTKDLTLVASWQKKS